jgi:hypothetical protein
MNAGTTAREEIRSEAEHLAVKGTQPPRRRYLVRQRNRDDMTDTDGMNSADRLTAIEAAARGIQDQLSQLAQHNDEQVLALVELCRSNIENLLDNVAAIDAEIHRGRD